MNTQKSFDQCLINLEESMKESYMLDAEGAPLDLSDDQLKEVQENVDAIKIRTQEAFKPFFDTLTQRVEEQQKQLAQLRGQLKPSNGGTALTASITLADGEFPTAEWIMANRKSKSEKSITGYNCYTIWYMAQHKGAGFPAKGSWDTQNKAAWNAIAKEINDGISSTASTSSHSSESVSVGASSEGSVDVPTVKGKGKKVSAYNMYTLDWMNKHPGQGFPPKDSWAQVPATEKAKFEAQAKAVKAQRA
jgi:hypothetical protein